MGSQFRRSNNVLPEVGLADDRRWIWVHHWNVVQTVVVVSGNGVQRAIGVDGTVAVTVIVHVTNVGVNLADGLDYWFFAHFGYLGANNFLQLGCALQKHKISYFTIDNYLLDIYTSLCRPLICMASATFRNLGRSSYFTFT